MRNKSIKRLIKLWIFCGLALGALGFATPGIADTIDVPNVANPPANINQDLNNDSVSITDNTKSTLSRTIGGASLTVTGGEFTINAGANSAYEAGIAGYNTINEAASNSAPTTIDNSTITVTKGNITSALFDNETKTPGSMNITGASEITLNGASANDAVIYGYGTANASQNINLDNAKINVDGNGTILTNYGSVNLGNGAQINVNPGGALQLQAGQWPSADGIVSATDSANIANYVIGGTDKGTANKFNIDGGTVSSPTPTNVQIDVNAGGELNVTAGGALKLHTASWNDGANIAVNNGAITVNGPNTNLWAGQIDIDGTDALINVAGPDGGSFDSRAVMAGYKGVNIKNGDINIGSGGEIIAGSTNGLNISGGTIYLAGAAGASPGDAGSAQLRFGGNKNALNTVNVISGGTIQINKDTSGSLGLGTLTTMTGGAINASGTLNLVGADIGDDGTVEPKTFAFRQSGGTISITNGGTANVVNNLAMTVSGGDLANAGTVNIENGSSLTISAPKALAKSTGTFNNSGTMTFTGASGTEVRGAIKNNGNLNLGAAGAAGGTIASPIQVDSPNGLVTVAAGTWKLAATGNINAKQGALNIGGKGSAATLDITQATAPALASGASGDGKNVGINILNQGTLTANNDQIFKADNLITGLKQIYLADGGMFSIDLKNAATTLEQLETRKDKVLAAGSPNKTISWQNLNTSQLGDLVPGTVAENLVPDQILAQNDLSYTPSSSGVLEAAAANSIGGKAIVAPSAPANKTLYVGSANPQNHNKLTLLGAGPNSNLITTSPNGAAAGIDTVNVREGQQLNLGAQGATAAVQGGKLNANVVLNKDSVLKTEAGQFTTGNITASAAGNGQITVQNGGNLTAGNVGSVQAPVYALDNIGATVKAGDVYTQALSNEGGDLTASTLSVSGLPDEASGIANNGGTINAQNLVTGQPDNEIMLNGTVNVSDTATVRGALQVGGNGATQLTADTVDLNEGRLVVSNSWNQPVSKAVIGKFTDSGADMTVEQNAQAVVGDTGTAMETFMQQHDLQIGQNNVVAALGVFSPITMKDGGAITVGAAPTDARILNAAPRARAAGADNAALPLEQQNRFTLGPNALLMVDGATAEQGAIKPGGAARNADGTLAADGNAIATFYPGSKIAVTDTEPNQNLVILGANANGVGWDVNNGGAQVYTDNGLIPAELVVANNALTIRTNAARSARETFPGLSDELATVIDRAYAAGQIGPQHIDNGERGSQFLSRALVMAGRGDADNAARALESAGRMVVLGAAPQMTLAANQAAGSAVTQRASFAEPNGNLYVYTASNQPVNKTPRDQLSALWIMPLYQSTNGFSMEAGPHDYDFSGSLGGVALGADFTVNDAARFGLAFNIGGGYAEGSGTLNKTTNNMNFWGIGAYAGFKQDNFGAIADVFYTSTYNKIRQDTPQVMEFGALKADVRGQAVSTGLRVDYTIPTEAMDITPHAGFRYTNLRTDSYRIKNDGNVIKGDAIEQNIWQFPVGVTMSRVVELDQGWRFKPMLDLNVTSAAGNVKAKSKVRFTGTSSKAELETKVMDYITYGGTVGLEFGNDVLSVGLNYSGQFGEESSAHGVFGTFRYEF